MVLLNLNVLFFSCYDIFDFIILVSNLNKIYLKIKGILFRNPFYF